MGLKKRPGEQGHEHCQRQIRQARLAVYQHNQPRWSAIILQSNMAPTRSYSQTRQTPTRQRHAGPPHMVEFEMVETTTDQARWSQTHITIQCVLRCRTLPGSYSRLGLADPSARSLPVDRPGADLRQRVQRALDKQQTRQPAKPPPNGGYNSKQPPSIHDTPPPHTQAAAAETASKQHSLQAPQKTDQKKTEAQAWTWCTACLCDCFGSRPVEQ